MTPNKSLFDTYQDLTRSEPVKLGNGQSLFAVGVGRIKIEQGFLDRVYYVPGLITNLFSIRSATEKGAFVEYVKDRVRIRLNSQEINGQ